MSVAPLKGLVAFPITPLDGAGEVDTEALKVVIQRLVDEEASGSLSMTVIVSRDLTRCWDIE